MSFPSSGQPLHSTYVRFVCTHVYKEHGQSGLGTEVGQVTITSKAMTNGKDTLR